MAIRAKYNGICKVSGKDITPGDLIENTPSGWALASEVSKDKMSGLQYVVASGPYPAQDNWGDEYPVWYVIFEGGEDIGEIGFESARSRESAIARGSAVAELNGVPFENDASWA